MITAKNISKFSENVLKNTLDQNKYIINSTLRQEGRHTSNTRKMLKENQIIIKHLQL